MEPRVEHLARELAKALAESETYAAVLKARQEMENHSAAQIMLRDLQDRQGRLQEKSRTGQQITKMEIAEFQRMAQVAEMNPYVRGLVGAEMALADMMMGVQEMLAKAVGLETAPPEGEVDGEEGESLQEEAPSPDKAAEEARKVRSKLWVPGS